MVKAPHWSAHRAPPWWDPALAELPGPYSALNPEWHVFACDLRGHGRSGHVADRYLMADYIADTVAFVRGVLTEPAVLIGSSLGGLIALGVGAAVPELVRAVVLLDPAFKVRNTRMADIPQFAWVDWVYTTIRSPRSRSEMIERCRQWAPEASEADLQGFADCTVRGCSQRCAGIAGGP